MTELAKDLADALTPGQDLPGVIVYGDEGPGDTEGVWLPAIDEAEDSESERSGG